MAPWPGRKDKGDPSPSPPPEQTAEVHDAAERGDADQLRQLASHLCNLGQELLEQTKEQVTAYLYDRASQAKTGTADDRTLAALGKKIDDLAARLTEPPTAEAAEVKPSDAPPTDTPDAPAPSPGVVQSLLHPLLEQLTRIDAKVNAMSGQTADHVQEKLAPLLMQLGDRLNQQFGAIIEGMQNLVQQVAPQQPEEPITAPPASMADWQCALLGADLAEKPGLEACRSRLLEGVLQGDEGACALVGQLLTFRSAMTDKMPPLLKDLGEAYYRWQPKTRPGSDPMETALVGWLRETMQDAGISNTIELVHPGERFDSTRHNAATRGVEITEVRGWIVLRENGKVYTKAAVAVQ